MSDILRPDWLDLIIRENDEISVTKRIVPSLQVDGSWSIDLTCSVIGYHITCKAHRVNIPIDELAAARMSNTNFCPKCKTHEPPVKNELSPETKALMRALAYQRVDSALDDLLNKRRRSA